MELVLIVGCFLSNILALDSLYNNEKKVSYICIIINLCLAVGLAFQLDQVQNIIYLVIAVVLVVVAAYGVKYYFKHHKKETVIIENQIESEINEDSED